MLNYHVIARYVSDKITVDISLRNLASKTKVEVFDNTAKNKLLTDYFGEIGTVCDTYTAFELFCEKYNYKLEDFTRLDIY